MTFRTRRSFATGHSRRIVWAAGLMFVLHFCEWALAQEAPPTPADNPLTRTLQRWHQWGTGQDEFGLRGRRRDQFDSRTPQDPELTRRLGEARLAIEEARWEQATQLLQSIMNDSAGMLVQQPDGTWKSLHSSAEELLRDGPEELLRNYRTQFEGIAQSQLQAALSARDENLLQELVLRYAFTDAGQAAIWKLSCLWRDRGEWIPAAEGFLRLATFESDAQRAETLRWQAAECFAFAGRLDRIPQLFNDVQGAPAWLTARLSAPPNPVATNASDQAITEIPPLIPVWNMPVVSRDRVRRQVARVLESLGDERMTPVSVQTPLFAGELVCLKTLHGIEVRDRNTGLLRWSTSSQNNPEVIFSSHAPDEGDVPQDGVDVLAPFDANADQNHQLVSLLYRDANYGALSTDGRQLFSVDLDHPVDTDPFDQYWRFRMREQQQVAPIDSRLTAFDIEQGHVRWRLGGPLLESVFSRPLAGTFFFGPPTVAGEELFVVGERDSDIFLHCLAARTGEVRWSLMIATAGQSVALDTVRCWWRCSPVVADGMVICPTTTGWLVAVDRYRRQIRWLTRYVPETEDLRGMRGGYSLHNILDINQRWFSHAPLVANGKVIVSPPELPDEFSTIQPVLMCLDQLTGEVIWRRAKADVDAAYMAGTWRDQLLLVGSDQALLVKLGDGTNSRIFDFADGVEPSGFGQFLGDNYLLPTTGSGLLSLELSTGRVRAVPVSNSIESLGSLAIDRNQLVSLSPLSLDSFSLEQQNALSSSEAARADFASQLLQAELLGLRHEYSPAAELVQSLSSGTNLTEADRKHLRLLEWNWRKELLLDSPSAVDSHAHLARLQELAQTEEETLFVRSRQADALRQAGQFEAAANAYLQLLLTAPDSKVAEEHRDVRSGNWACGRLLDLLKKVSDLDRQSIHDRVTAGLMDAASRSTEHTIEHLTSAGDSPWETPLLVQMAKSLAKETDQAQLSLVLQRLAASADPAVASTAMESLARLTTTQSPISPQPAASDNSPISGPWELVISSFVQRGNALDVVRTGHFAAPFEPLQLHYNAEGVRLQAHRAGDRNLVWSTPLHRLSEVEHHGPCSVHGLGGVALAPHQGVLHCIGLKDGNLLWTLTPASDSKAVQRLRGPAEYEPQHVYSPSTFIANNQLGAKPSTHGFLLDASPQAAVLWADGLHVVDTLTGTTLWVDRQIPARISARILGSQVLLLSAGEPPELRRLLDGRRSQIADTHWNWNQAIATSGHHVVFLEGGATPTTELQQWTLHARLLDGTTVWTSQLPKDIWIARLDETTLCLLDSQGGVSTLDLNNGTVQKLGEFPNRVTAIPARTHVIRDAERTYVIEDFGSPESQHIVTSAIRASKRIVAFDSAGRGRVWEVDTQSLTQPDPSAGANPVPQDEATARNTEREAVTALNLLTNDFAVVPCLLLYGDRLLSRGNLNYHRSQFVCIDKQTGQVLLNAWRSSSSGGVFGIEYHGDSRQIFLQTQDEMLCIRPSGPPPAPSVEKAP